MYPTAGQLDDLCTLVNPQYPHMGLTEKADFQYRIRDAYHLVTTGQQAPSNGDEVDVKDVLPEFQKLEAAKEAAVEAERKKLKEIDQKASEDIAKITEQEQQMIAKAEAQKAEIKAKADEAKAKVEAEAAAQKAKVEDAAKPKEPANQTHKK